MVPGVPHHVTQRGNRREAIFFQDGNQEIYLDLLTEQTAKANVAAWAYCLMPNHVHLILTPEQPEGLGLAVCDTHRRYTNFINARGRWIGHLFQSRFASVALDHVHLVRAMRYVSLNPVRARLVSRPEEWKWSSVRAHLGAAEDAIEAVRTVLERVPHLKELLAAEDEDDFTDFRRAEATGRPLGTPDFVDDLEKNPRTQNPTKSSGAEAKSRNGSNAATKTTVNRYHVPVLPRIPKAPPHSRHSVRC